MKTLSAAELTSLKEVSRGIYQGPIPKKHAERLLGFKLIYRDMGDLRLTTAGLIYLEQGR